MEKMNEMFSFCKNIKELDLSSFNTCSVTIMDNLFRECHKLQSIDLSNFNTSNVKSMIYMFYNCNSLTSLDLSNFDTKKVNTITISKLSIILFNIINTPYKFIFKLYNKLVKYSNNN